MNRFDRKVQDCPDARPLIDAYLLDELDEAARGALADHLRGCPACSAELGGSTRLIELLGSLAVPSASAGLDERILAAALADRRRRHAHRSWIEDLRIQVLRGAMRTTGTLVATVVTVALLGGAFAFAASQFVAQLPPFTSHATITPVATSTPTPTPTPRAAVEPKATPTEAPTPTGVVVPTVAPTATLAPTPTATPGATPEPTPPVTAPPTAGPTPTTEPTPEPTPSPTEKVRRTPPPSPTPSPSASGTEPTTSP